jgi:hypothetical protein
VTHEELAVHWRAETGVIPYGLWLALTDEERGRINTLTQTAARRMVNHQTQTTAQRLVKPRTITPTLDAVALADLVERSKTP